MPPLHHRSFGIGAAVVVAAHAAYFGYRYLTEQRKDEEDVVSISLPGWAYRYFDRLKHQTFVSELEMMTIAVDLSQLNVAHETGGPFGSAIFEVSKDGKAKLFSVGVNRVVPLSNSTLHGEMVAIQYAQKKIKNFSLRSSEKEYHLYTSCEPCVQCLGGTLWSGVSKLVCAATKDDAEAIGFNEGPVFPESYKQLEAAGVRVVRNVMQKEGSLVLQKYGETGVIYNA